MQLAAVYKSQYIAHNAVIDAGTMIQVYIKYTGMKVYPFRRIISRRTIRVENQNGKKVN